jgi:hypothetical protein
VLGDQEDIRCLGKEPFEGFAGPSAHDRHPDAGKGRQVPKDGDAVTVEARLIRRRREGDERAVQVGQDAQRRMARQGAPMVEARESRGRGGHGGGHRVQFRLLMKPCFTGVELFKRLDRKGFRESEDGGFK